MILLSTDSSLELDIILAQQIFNGVRTNIEHIEQTHKTEQTDHTRHQWSTLNTSTNRVFLLHYVVLLYYDPINTINSVLSVVQQQFQ